MLSGTITDKTGAVIPGATVTLIDEDLGFQRQVKTSDLGLYVFTLLQPGKYSLTAQKAGLSAYTQKDITLQVGQGSRILSSWAWPASSKTSGRNSSIV